MYYRLFWISSLFDLFLFPDILLAHFWHQYDLQDAKNQYDEDASSNPTKAKFKECNDEGIACGGKVGHQATSMRAKPTNAWADNFMRHKTSAVSVCQSIYKVSQKCKPGHHRCPKCPKSVEGASAASHSVSVPLPAAASAPRPGLSSQFATQPAF